MNNVGTKQVISELLATSSTTAEYGNNCHKGRSRLSSGDDDLDQTLTFHTSLSKNS